jgi:CDP-glucose 4,6-dehydratase
MMELQMSDFWRGKRVLITGHSGFKGWWLSQVLQILGAEVAGFSNVPTNAYTSRPFLLEENDLYFQQIGDVSNFEETQHVLIKSKPHIVFHLAAQSSVIEGHLDPVTTWATNCVGSTNVLLAASKTSPPPTVVVITTDKVYRNNGENKSFTENDSLGFFADPYSASKAVADQTAQSFALGLSVEGHTDSSIVIARAGNVIGGGDWLPRRIIPDCVRAFASNETLYIRNPYSTRPYQHVLDVIFGYLKLAQYASEKKIANAETFNFGPENKENVNTEHLCREFFGYFPSSPEIKYEKSNFQEQIFLSLDSKKALELLGWSSKLDFSRSLKLTADWYLGVLNGLDARTLTQEQINWYLGTYET